MKGERFFELIHLYLSNEITDDEQIKLDEAIQKDEKLALLFQQLTKSKALHLSSSIIEEKFITIVNDLPVKNTIKSVIARNLLRLSFLQYAAAILIAIISISLLWTNYRDSSYEQKYSNTASTNYGEQKKVTLPDGTNIWLNNKSSITYKENFGKDNRDIVLEGEAYFDVASNKEVPMFIHTKDITVKVIGTSFNIRSYIDEPLTETSLVEGKIELFIRKEDEEVTVLHVVPGEKIKIHYHPEPTVGEMRAKKDLVVKDFVISRSVFLKDSSITTPTEIAWRENTLAFDSEPFENVASKLEKWYNVHIDINKEALKHLEISGNIKEGRIEDALEIIKLTGIDFNYKRVNNHITIY